MVCFADDQQSCLVTTLFRTVQNSNFVHVVDALTLAFTVLTTFLLFMQASALQEKTEVLR